jgi:tRNA-dihydrouridine synthase B
MAEAARIVESMGADIVDVNMGCPVPKIAKHNAGCSLMREPEHAQAVVAAMAKAVSIPVTVKMRAGWDERAINAPEMARRMADAGAAAVAVHGRTAAQSYTGSSDWDLIARVAAAVTIPVFGSGDCVEPAQVVERMRSGVAGVLVGRGALRNPWIFEQALAIAGGAEARAVTMTERGQFLLDYIDLLISEGLNEREGFRHVAPGQPSETAPARGRERWVINKLRALNAWYTKGIENGSHLRVAVNAAGSVAELREIIREFFLNGEPAALPETLSLPSSR